MNRFNQIIEAPPIAVARIAISEAAASTVASFV